MENHVSNLKQKNREQGLREGESVRERERFHTICLSECPDIQILNILTRSTHQHSVPVE